MVLSWITVFTTAKGGGNPAIPFVYGIGSSATTIILFCKGRYAWGTHDTVVAVLVTICVVLWLTLGARPAFIASVAAGSIAVIPFVLLTWQAPGVSPIIPNIGFLFTNVLAFLGAATWKLEDRLYTGVSTVLCFALVLPWVLYWIAA